MNSTYTAHAAGTIETKHWDEKTWDGQPWNEVQGAKLTHAKVSTSFQGDIAGESTEEWLMIYRDDGSANFVGLERIVGRLGERTGSFVLQHSGAYAGGKLHSTCFVVPGSASGDLLGLRGEGTYIFDGQHGDPTRYTFDYGFE